MVVSVVGLEDITVYYGSNSTAMSAARTINPRELVGLHARLRVPPVVVLAGGLGSRQSVEPVTPLC